MVRRKQYYAGFAVYIQAVLLSLSLSMLSQSIHADSTPTLVLNDTNEPPFTTKNRDGFLDVIATEAFRRAGARLKLVKLPAERGLMNANAGIEDGDLVRIIGLEKLYPNLMRVPEKLIEWEFVAYSKNSKIRPHWDILYKKVVGHITGWKIYEQHLRSSTQLVVTTTGAEQLFHLLDRDRIEVALYARWMGQAYIKQLELKGMHQLEPSLAKREMFIYLHNKHAKFIPKIAKALRDLKKEGFYQRMQREKLLPYNKKGML